MRMAAVQAYACASGKGKKPSRTNALARRHRGTGAAADSAFGLSKVALARLQAHPQLKLRGVHLAGRSPRVSVSPPRQPPNRGLRYWISLRADGVHRA